MATGEVGESIPAHTPHAVSVSLPTWKANVAYEEGEEWVMSKLTTGYPRFFINKHITALAEDVIRRYGHAEEKAMLFPSTRTAKRCAQFISAKDPSSPATQIRVLNLVLDLSKAMSSTLRRVAPTISAVIFPSDKFTTAMQYWQHSGDGVSSRRAEFCHSLFQEDLLIEDSSLNNTANNKQRLCKGPKRYQRPGSWDNSMSPAHTPRSQYPEEHSFGEPSFEVKESSQFVEERFGRNLDVSLIDNARIAIRRRIAGSLITEVDLAVPMSPNMGASNRGVANLSEEDVYLYPCGMNAIFNAHQLLLRARGSLKSIVFGFPYVDTLKILEKFGPGCIFYGHGSSEELDDLEARLKSGEKYLALFCEFPGNPLLGSPDLQRVKKLADLYHFGVVVDETIGNFINIHVLPYADILVSSLTKIFTGECNVSGGSGILNPNGQFYSELKAATEIIYEDNYWVQDVIFMERNSRDFVSRIGRINRNAEEICLVLQNNPSVKMVYYPKFVPTRTNYDYCRTPNGGYGGLLSVTFHRQSQAEAFFDRIQTAKGPSLGTNFTLASPYVILAHYQELDWAASFGIESGLVRVSVGLEETERLKRIFLDALGAAEDAD